MKISISRGATVNLGSYESARVDISLEANTEDAPLEVQTEASYADWLDNFVSSWLSAQVEDIEKGAGLPPRGASRFIGTKE